MQEVNTTPSYEQVCQEDEHVPSVEEHDLEAEDQTKADDDDCEAEAVAAVVTTTSRRRRLFGRRSGRARVGAPSWWTELKNVETSGCSFVLGYLALSFVLMTLMFNMREIVGDDCLGSKEQKQEDYREQMEKAMQLRRRSPLPADEEERFDQQLEDSLLFEGDSEDAMEYLQNHRVPITIQREDEFDPDP